MSLPEYIKAHKGKYSRPELLQSCRMMGLTAHGIKTEDGLLEVIWRAINRAKEE